MKRVVIQMVRRRAAAILRADPDRDGFSEDLDKIYGREATDEEYREAEGYACWLANRIERGNP